ncbi:MAG TPA: class I SAM-dependent methyltransferase, partial [Nitrososphaera sp.]|nr:class I SAM-dependent methyltransferase [Nitrososphaera sp.]
MSDTRNRVIERYHTVTRRADLHAPGVVKTLFKSYDRILQGLLPANMNASMLDAACGEGGLLLYLRQKGYENLDGFDLSPENVNLCHEVGLDFVKRWDVLKIDSYAGA